ncbi:MAG TPA: alpha/beta fold hydrolase [Solirubrobacterales bacterium]|nr:alpha/beta fold hydrolase [Solirubrobacterales bacterium]
MRERLGKTTVAIFGHSWGSALGVLHAARFPRKVAAYVGSGQYGDAAAGEPASYAMWAETSRLNLLDLVPALEMPVFFLLGRNDHWVAPEASVAYFEALTAPSKGVVWFEQSGHEPFVDEPAKFNRAMAELARPVLPSDL